MKLLGNRILIKPIPQLQIGLIQFPAACENQANVGGVKLHKVLAVGPGRRTRKGVAIPIECAPGDNIICHSYTDGPQDYHLPDGQLVITADQVLAVIPVQLNHTTKKL